MGVGQSFAFVGLVSTLVLQAIFSGGVSKPQWALTFSAFFHVVRLFGGQIGVAFLGHFIAQREKLHSNLLGLHVQEGSWTTDGNLRSMTAGVLSKSSGLAAATGRATGLLDGRLRLQAYTLTFIDGFHMLAWACICALMLIAFLCPSPLSYGDISMVQQQSRVPREAKS